MKYVILIAKANGLVCPIVFDENITHRDVAVGAARASGPHRIVSAGFVHHRHGEWVCGGDSESLGGMKSRDEDSLILRLFLDYGLSGLELQNAIELSNLNPELFKTLLEKYDADRTGTGRLPAKGS
jgi:hypothetical protein